MALLRLRIAKRARGAGCRAPPEVAAGADVPGSGVRWFPCGRTAADNQQAHRGSQAQTRAREGRLGRARTNDLGLCRMKGGWKRGESRGGAAQGFRAMSLALRTVPRSSV